MLLGHYPFGAAGAAANIPLLNLIAAKKVSSSFLTPPRVRVTVFGLETSIPFHPPRTTTTVINCYSALLPSNCLRMDASFNTIREAVSKRLEM